MIVTNQYRKQVPDQPLASEPLIIIIGGLLINDYPLRGVMAHFPRGHSHFIDINNNDYNQIKEALLTLVIPRKHQQCILIGYSTGGVIILKLLSETNLNVDKIILVNSTPYFLEDNHWQGIKRQDFEKLYSRLLKQPFADFCSYFHQLCFYPQPIPKLTICTPSATAAATQYWLDFLQNHDLRSVLAGIAQPTLLLYSESDVINQINYFNSNQLLQQQMLTDSTHSDPDQTNLLNYITEFLNA